MLSSPAIANREPSARNAIAVIGDGNASIFLTSLPSATVTIRTVLLARASATCAPSWRNATATMGWSEAGMSRISFPSVGFQIRRTLSTPTVASRVPSSLRARDLIGPLVSKRRGSTTGRSQSFAVLSLPPERTCLPFGETATARTSLVCPSYFRISLRLATSQSRTVLSNPAVARVLPSGLQATEYTASVWPSSVPITAACCAIANPAVAIATNVAIKARG